MLLLDQLLSELLQIHPMSRDWTGLTTFSTFQGRSFIRSAVPGGDVEAYDTNHIFDDVSDRFNGITSDIHTPRE